MHIMEPQIKQCVLSSLKHHYNIVPSTITELSGYDGRNFLISSEKAKGQKKTCVVKTESYIIRKDKTHEANMEMQHTVMGHLNKTGIFTSRPIKNVDNGTFSKWRCGGEEYLMQVLTFIEGDSIHKSVNSTNELCDFCENYLGKFLANCHLSLEDLDLPDAQWSDYLWYAEDSQLVQKYMGAVEDERMANLMKKYMEIYKTKVLHRLPELRLGFVHGDFTDTNVLVQNESSSKGVREWKISGLIDFSDCHHGSLVGELGVCVAYIMMKASGLPEPDPMEIAKRLIQSYESILPLTKAEKDALYGFVVGRLVVSYVMGMYKLKQNPENEETIMLQSRNIPKLIEILEYIGPDSIIDYWFS